MRLPDGKKSKIYRCPVCYRKVPKQANRSHLKYCKEEHKLLARRILQRVRSQAKQAAERAEREAMVDPFILPVCKRIPGSKKIKCIMCGKRFTAPGMVVGDRVVPSVRTCSKCREKQEYITSTYDEGAFTNLLALIDDRDSAPGIGIEEDYDYDD